MRFTTITLGLLFVAVSVCAKGSDTILEKDPYGLFVTLISVIVVLSALLGLAGFMHVFGSIMKRVAHNKVAEKKGVSKTESPLCNSVENAEIIAAIALAIKLNKAEMHDLESEVITINRVARAYSPWSSKIHGLTQVPRRIKN